MNYGLLFPDKIKQFGLWLQTWYKDALERKSSPKSIVRDLLADFFKSGWVPEWVLIYFIAEVQMETNTLIEEVRNRMLDYIRVGALSMNWKSEALGITIARITEEDQNLLRNQLCSFPLCIFKKPSLQTLQRGDYCAIRLPNNSYGIVIVIKMLDNSHGIIQFDGALFEKPPVSDEIIRVKPVFMQIHAVHKIVKTPFVSTYLYLARTGYWRTGHLQNDLCNQLPVLASDDGIPVMYPDAVPRRLCSYHEIPVPESIYVGASPYIQACRSCGKNLRKKENFGWASMI